MQQPDSNEFFVSELPQQHVRRGPPSRTPAIIGFLIGGAFILTLGFIGSALQDREGGDDGAPPLGILSPADGDTVDNPVVLRFTTPAPLRLERAGWVAGDLHLHAMTDHREIMPGASDIAAEDQSFVWRLPVLPPGEHRLFLTWAGRNHANLRGPSDTVVVIVR